MLEKTLKSPLDSREIKPVNPKGNQPWKFIWRTDAETKAPIFWPPDAKTRLIGKDPDAGKDWGQEEKGATWWDGWMALTQWTWVWATLGDGDGQGSLACCDSWGHKESDKTEWLNWTELNWFWHLVLLLEVCVCLVAQSLPYSLLPHACQVPLSMEFSRPEYWVW